MSIMQIMYDLRYFSICLMGDVIYFQRGTTPLHLAASVNSAPIVKLLLRHGADPDPLDHV